MNSRVVHALEGVSRFAGAAVTGVGALSLVGWVMDADALKAMFTGGVTIKANAAVCLVLLGAALLLLGPGRELGGRKGRTISGRVLAAVAAGIGGLTLVEHVVGLDLGIDQVLFHERPGAAATASPGRMGPPACVSYLLSGLALCLLDARIGRRRGGAPAQWLALLVGLIALLPLIGYAYRIEPLYGASRYTGIALHTALSILVLAVGVLAARPTVGLMTVVCLNDAGGVTARRLLLPAVLVPLALGWLRTVAQRAGWIDDYLGRPLLVLSMVVTFTGLVWWNARALSAFARRSAAAEDERRRTDEARRMVEFRFQRLVERSPLSTQLFWPDGRTRQVNAAFTRLWGITFEQLHDYNILGDPQLVATGAMPLMERAFAGEAVAIDPILYRPDRGAYAGEARWVGAQVYPVKDDAGRVEEVVLVHIDVTEQRVAEEALRQSEWRLRSLVEQSAAGIAQADLTGRLQFANDRYCQIVGYPPAEVPGLRVHDLTHPDDRAETDDRVADAAATGREYAMEKRYVRKGGSIVWVAVSASVIKDAAGNPQSIMGVVIDVSDRKRAEEERDRLLERERAARAEAERASRIKDEFLATLSHELRTPLNAILGWAQLLKGGGSDPAEVAEAVGIIDRNARAQARIVEDLLDMSRIVSGRLKIEAGAVAPADVVRAAVETVRAAADAKGVAMQTVLDPLAGPVRGDASRLQQVFWNLLANAVKFTPRGGRVRVVLGRVGSHVEVTVSDTGEGIAPDFVPHVFERFRQGDGSTTRRHGGLGLGLSIVKQLVELHGGTVGVESAGEGRGATFTVALPLMAAVPVAAPDAEVGVAARDRELAGSGAAGTADGLRLDGVRVLIVDDDADARGLVERLLAERGAVTTTAGSAEEGFELLRARRPDVLVSDIGMPGEDGYALMTRVRALAADEGGDTPGVALSAYARVEDRTSAMLAGFRQHLAKPVEPGELVAVVAVLAGRTVNGARDDEVS